MKLNFLQLPSEDRKLYIEEAAGRRGLSPVILEKDFWVCWLLQEAECIEAVRGRLTPELEGTVSDLLGKAQEPWLEFVVDPSSHSPVIFFRYPTPRTDPTLDCGARGDPGGCREGVADWARLLRVN